MSYTNRFKIILVMILLTTITIGGAYASTVTVSGGQISKAGDVISVPITLDVAENGLIYDQMTISVGNPTVAQVTKVDFPTWAGIHNVETALPATTVFTTAGDLPPQGTPFHNQAGAINVPIATVTLQGLKPGSTSVTVQLVYQDLTGSNIRPTVKAGTIQVGGVVPTTTTTVIPTTTTTTTTVVPTTTTTTVVPTATTTTVVPTTPTPVPTMPVPTGPTGQVYFSTTPQGAAIFIDGARTNAVTPFIIAVPVGTHQVVFKLAGYNDLQAGFTAQQSSMATVSRRLSPGASVIPTTPVTTVATTVPRTTGTQITTVPTTVPTVVPTTVPTTVPGYWSYQAFIPSWLKNYLPFF